MSARADPMRLVVRPTGDAKRLLEGGILRLTGAARCHRCPLADDRALIEQIKLMQPQFILTLGAYLPSFMAPLSPALKHVWSGVKSLTMLDEKGDALVFPSFFEGVLHPIAVVALTHPAYRHVNVKYRQYGNLQGDEAERALVRDALVQNAHDSE